MKVLAIGDPHFMITNIPNVEKFMTKLMELVVTQNPDLIVMLGDLLHEHERLHITALNKAYELIRHLSQHAITYCIVGNHDLINNRQFLTKNHWMNAMKSWDNVVVVDTVQEYQNFLFVPYVPPGRFIEALVTKRKDWIDATCIFAHQEFRGCKMGAIVSEEGDIWEPGWNLVVSGHIHSRQWVGENVYYPGASIQQAFGESDRNIIPVITFEDGKYNIVEHDLRLPRKKIIYTELSKMEDLQLKDTEDQVKITLSGNYEEFKTFKKSKKYKEIISKGVKIVYKQKKIKTENLQITESSFDKILFELINQNSNKYLLSDYHHVFLNREKNCKI